MTRWTRLRVHLLAAVSIISAVAVPARAESVAFVHVDVIPMDSERVLRDQTVVVGDGRITAFGPAAEVAVPRGAKVVDVRGHYLLPGLIETHVHPDESDDTSAYVVHGVTTVADLDSADDARTADAFVTGYFVPRGTPLFDIVAGLARWLQVLLWVSLIGWSGAKLVRYLRRSFVVRRPRALVVARWLTLVVAVLTAGCSVLFAMVTPDNPAGHAIGSTPLLIAMIVVAVLDALVATLLALLAARRWEEEAGFVHRVHIVAVAAAAVTLVLTMLYWIPLSWRSSAGGVERLARTSRETGARLIPNLAAYSKEGRERDVEFVKSLVSAFHREGVTIVLGTDPASPAFTPGETMREELELLVESGLRPYDALRAATVAPSKMLGVSDELGTIEVGKRADVIVLAQNPLDDIGVVVKPLGVISEGRWLGPETLQRLK
ncbi:MAG: amidohydrolase family protein [Acidobacteriota bacterium]|nr:amidohydrolase family protein [Acidobacteriota bacterium]